MKLPLSFLLFGIFGLGCQTTIDPSPTHMLRLICEGSEGKTLQSRFAVIDIRDSVYDYGFAIGHGVPSERPCVVKDFSGESQSANLIRLADGYKSGTKTDWAIIRFNKISTRGLVRYQLDPIKDLAQLNQNQFYFAQALGLSKNVQPCNLSILNFKDGYHRATHDCRATSGQSGSPITRVEDNTHKLVGLHIGHFWMLESPETGRPDRKGYINLLDQKTVEEIERIISANRS